MTSAQLAETLNLDDTIASSQKMGSRGGGKSSMASSMVGNYHAMGLAPGSKIKSW